MGWNCYYVYRTGLPADWIEVQLVGKGLLYGLALQVRNGWGLGSLQMYLPCCRVPHEGNPPPANLPWAAEKASSPNPAILNSCPVFSPEPWELDTKHEPQERNFQNQTHTHTHTHCNPEAPLEWGEKPSSWYRSSL